MHFFKIISLFFLVIFIFAACAEKDKPSKKTLDLSIEAKKAYIQKGKKIAGQTFKVLSGQLQKAMKEGGVSNAIQYCNISAYPITDSLANQYGANIRRASAKYRNPKNKPTKREVIVLAEFAHTAATGKTLKPIVKKIDAQHIGFYAPIKTNAFCLNCHGKQGETLSQANYELIRKYYPNDKAIGYNADELRGIWSIQLKAE